MNKRLIGLMMLLLCMVASTPLPSVLLYCAYDGALPYETDFTGDPTGHAGQVAYRDTVIFRPGQFDKGVQVAEEATNMCSNPSFDIDLSGWSEVEPGNGTVDRIVTDSVYGGGCLEIVGDTGGGTTYAAMPNLSVVPGEDYTFSLYYKILGGTGTVSSYVTTHNATWSAATNFHALYTTNPGVVEGWQSESVSFECPTGEDKLNIYFVSTGGEGLTLRFDAVQLTDTADEVTYLDGSLGDGHSWSGTEHNSPSTRDGAQLYYDNPLDGSDDSFWIHLWLIHEYDNTYNPGGAIYLFYEGQVYAYFSPADDKIYFSDGYGSVSTEGLTFEAGSMMLDFIADETRGMEIYIDGELAGEGTYEGPEEWGDYLYIGSSEASGHINAVIDDLVIARRAPSADEIAALYQHTTPFSVEPTAVTILLPSGSTATITEHATFGDVLLILLVVLLLGVRVVVMVRRRG